MIAFEVERWQAWAPGLADAAAWQAWATAPHRPQGGESQPACEFLPPMQRRRLSPLARISLQAAWPLLDEGEQLPFVFGSRHGESPRTYELLGQVAAGEPLSPTQFGLSVHNAIAGQWSMLRGQRGESVALAGMADTFEHSLLEAALLLAEGAPAAIVVMAEQAPPPAYARWIKDVPFSYALALRLRTGADRPGHWQLRLGAGNTEDAAHAGIDGWPPALAWLASHLQERDALNTHSGNRTWHWQRQR